MKIKYDYNEDYGIVLDTTKAPFDGNPVLIKTALGWAEAWWADSDITETCDGPEYDGFCWVILDDTTTAMIDEVDEWVELPVSALELRSDS